VNRYFGVSVRKDTETEAEHMARVEARSHRSKGGSASICVELTHPSLCLGVTAICAAPSPRVSASTARDPSCAMFCRHLDQRALWADSGPTGPPEKARNRGGKRAFPGYPYRPGVRPMRSFVFESQTTR
jgi:hypothetical protein